MQIAATALRSWLSLATLMLGLQFTIASTATAQSCSFSISTLDFGSVSLASGGAVDSTSTLTANCSGSAGATVRVCVSLGAGSGSAAASGSPRYMTSGSNTLAYNMYTDAARTSIWGSTTGLLGLFGPTALSVTLNAQGSGTASRSIYGRISSNQQTVPPGAYQSIFSGTESRITYQYLGVLSCLAILTPGTNVPFTVQANVIASCSVSVTTLDFGSTGSLNQPIDGSSTISATCPNTVPYTIGLSGGNAAATNPTQRKMSKSADQVTYGLYQDAGRSTPWGDTNGSNTRSLVGTGGAQSATIYGRIPGQAPKPAGQYNDTVVLTLTY